MFGVKSTSLLETGLIQRVVEVIDIETFHVDYISNFSVGPVDSSFNSFLGLGDSDLAFPVGDLIWNLHRKPVSSCISALNDPTRKHHLGVYLGINCF